MVIIPAQQQARDRSCSSTIFIAKGHLGTGLHARAYGMALTAMERDSDEKPKTGGKKRKGASPKGKPYERPRGGSPKAIGDLMPQIGRTAFRRFGFVQSSVVSRWHEIVGPQHARVSAPESIRFPPGEKSQGTLHLVVMPAHAPLLQHVIPEIIERVNRFFGYSAIAKIRIRQGHVHAGDSMRGGKSASGAASPPSLKPIPMELGDSLRDIGDPELRTVLESLARSMGGKEGK